jgi:hypothetical protein
VVDPPCPPEPVVVVEVVDAVVVDEVVTVVVTVVVVDGPVDPSSPSMTALPPHAAKTRQTAETIRFFFIQVLSFCQHIADVGCPKTS